MNVICDSLRKISTTIDQKNFKDKLMLRMSESHLLIFVMTNFSMLYSVIYMLTVKYVVKINFTWIHHVKDLRIRYIISDLDFY